MAGGGRGLPQARSERGDILQAEGKVRRLEVSDARRLRLLEEENSKLKRLLTETVLDNAILRDLLGKV